MGTYWVWVRVGSLLEHDIPVPGLRVSNILPVPVWVTRGYSNVFRPTLYTVLHDRYTYQKRNACWCWHAGVKWLGVVIVGWGWPLSLWMGMNGCGWCGWLWMIVDDVNGCGWSWMVVDGCRWLWIGLWMVLLEIIVLSVRKNKKNTHLVDGPRETIACDVVIYWCLRWWWLSTCSGSGGWPWMHVDMLHVDVLHAMQTDRNKEIKLVVILILWDNTYLVCWATVLMVDEMWMSGAGVTRARSLGFMHVCAATTHW